MKLNYLNLLNQFWQLRRSKRITGMQADLYYFLIHECNMKYWENPFECSNVLIKASIGISEPSLCDARNRLKQLGLIEFEPGKRKECSPIYSILYLNNFSINRVESIAESMVKTEYKHEPLIKPNQTKQDFIYKGEPEKFSLLTKIEISNSIEYLDRVAQKKFSQDELISYFEAFKIQYSTEYYVNRGKVINHFRDWLKKQQNGQANNSISSKSGRDKQADASAALVAKLRQVTGAG